MKSDKDIKDEVLLEMKQNGTLVGELPTPAEGVDLDEVRTAFVERFSAKMNEELRSNMGVQEFGAIPSRRVDDATSC